MYYEIRSFRVLEQIVSYGGACMEDIIVTTGDLHQEYDIIGPVYFQVSNKGIFSSALSELIAKYQEEIDSMRENGAMSQLRNDWGFLYGEYSVGQNEFESAFYVATQELKKRAKLLHANAIIGVRQDIDLDTNAFQFFYLQMYGTAIKIHEKKEKTLSQRYNDAVDMLRNELFEQAEDVFVQLGDFRDSKEQAQKAWQALRLAEEKRIRDETAEKEKLGGDIARLIDKCGEMNSAHEIYEYLGQFDLDNLYIKEMRSIAAQYKEMERMYGKSPKSVIQKYNELLTTKWK